MLSLSTTAPSFSASDPGTSVDDDALPIIASISSTFAARCTLKPALLPYQLNVFDFHGSIGLTVLRRFLPRQTARQIKAMRSVRAGWYFAGERRVKDVRSGEE